MLELDDREKVVACGVIKVVSALPPYATLFLRNAPAVTVAALSSQIRSCSISSSESPVGKFVSDRQSYIHYTRRWRQYSKDGAKADPVEEIYLICHLMFSHVSSLDAAPIDAKR